MDKNINEALKNFLQKTKKKALGEAIPEMQQEITQNVINSFAPVIQQLANQAKISKEDLSSVLKEIQIIAPEARIPEIRIPDIKIPTPQVTVNVPKAETPVVNVSPTPVSFPESMSIHGFDYKNPLPIRLVDLKGRPYEALGGGSSGGRGDFFAIRDIQTSSGASVIDQVDGTLKVSGSFSASTTPYGTYYASDTVGSINLIQVGGNSVVVGTGYSDNAIRVVHATDVGISVTVQGAVGTLATNIVDSSGIGYSGSNPVPITWVSGAGPGSTAATIVDSTGVAYEGANPFPIRVVTDSISTLNVAITDSSGIQYSGSNPVPITGTVVASSITASVASAIVDSGGGQYSTSNPFPINTVAGGPDSMFIMQARTTLPTAVSDGTDVRMIGDKYGRQIIRPVQVRDLTVSAYASFTTGTEATLLSATAGKMYDLIYILASNNSTVAVGVDVRGVTAGNILMHLEIPANGVVGVSTPVPIPQTSSDTGNAWTVDLPDITGTTVYVSALFTTES